MASNYSNIERIGARILSHLPLTKRVVKCLYQKLVFTYYRKSYHCRLVRPMICVSSNTICETFFGYYDKSPANLSGSYVIYQQCMYPTKFKPDCTKPINVTLQEVTSEKKVAELASYAYNWQQGTKLQWLTDRRFIFNDYDPILDRYVAKVFDIDACRIIRIFPLPIYDCYGENFALTLNFDRLARLAPDYGYSNRLDKPMDLNDIDSDGIFFINMRDGKYHLIVTLNHIIKIEPKNSMRGALHTINHIMISPDGENFVFIHRWYKNGRRFDRLMHARKDGSKIRVLAGFGMVSHCFWVDESTILAYMRGPGYGDAYWLINTVTGELVPIRLHTIDKYGDGHPNVCGDWFVTDTYPDKARMQHLFLCNWKTGEVREIGEFFHSFEYKRETRCDLHPRFSPNGKEIFFDSVFDGCRRLYKLEVKL